MLYRGHQDGTPRYVRIYNATLETIRGMGSHPTPPKPVHHTLVDARARWAGSHPTAQRPRLVWPVRIRPPNALLFNVAEAGSHPARPVFVYLGRLIAPNIGLQTKKQIRDRKEVRIRPLDGPYSLTGL